MQSENTRTKKQRAFRGKQHNRVEHSYLQKKNTIENDMMPIVYAL